MGVTAKFTPESIQNVLWQKAKMIDKNIINRLKFLGEKLLAEARAAHTYKDQTGNLTSSMGYVIIVNGKVVSDGGFNSSSSAFGGNVGTASSENGGQIGKVLADKMASEYPTGYVLLMVAGMNYAAYVEAKGYNVLTSAEQLARKEMPRMLNALKMDIKKL